MKINTMTTPINGIAVSACGRLELSTPAAGAFTGAGYGMRAAKGLVSPQADAIKVKSHGIRAWSCPTT
ncbi:hypothetical protein FB381_1227 [Nocardioides albertanoniae]|uniref:Uncharacterized protein n=1 Tax=Nocardioides albertanoniae TaxID=1175486 RepID=A0A543A448_9ACTN|nr:hypothetical protein [Nocardioides albertanoniae]TQL67352.1 hypothetical protein FB381_1227 [Nocardioides albertanoniae]